MITESEADMRAASIMLEQCGQTRIGIGEDRPRDWKELDAAIGRIEQWLRRRALGGDKIAIGQVEKELGHQVRMRGRKP